MMLPVACTWQGGKRNDTIEANCHHHTLMGKDLWQMDQEKRDFITKKWWSRIENNCLQCTPDCLNVFGIARL